MLSNWLKKFLRLWPELWSLPLALISWVLSPYALRWIDPTAGTFDAGVLQKILLAAIAMCVFNGLAWLGMWFNFPRVFKWYSNYGETPFNALTAWQKHLVCFGLYLFYLLGLVVLMHS